MERTWSEFVVEASGRIMRIARGGLRWLRPPLHSAQSRLALRLAQHWVGSECFHDLGRVFHLAPQLLDQSFGRGSQGLSLAPGLAVNFAVLEKNATVQYRCARSRSRIIPSSESVVPSWQGRKHGSRIVLSWAVPRPALCAAALQLLVEVN